MDGATASILLGCMVQNPIEDNISKIHDLSKSLTGKGPSEEARKFVQVNMGKKCEIKYTGHIGIIEGLNENDRVFYTGDRYPVYVMITESSMPEAINSLFEYDLDQVIVIE